MAQHVAKLVEAGVQRQAPLRAVMLDRLGPNVWHRTLAEAMAVLEELEETAKLWVLRDGNAVPLTEAAIDDLRQAFGA